MPNHLVHDELSRRNILLLGGLSSIGLASSVHAHLQPSAPQPTSPTPSPTPIPANWPTFPRHDPALIAEVVGKSHFDEKRVRELIGMHPALVNSAWDWGFGDWETPLGAASHVGRREIAEFLIDKGARIDLFAAAMLGYTDVVKAFITASPGSQRLLGPHGITLLAHARAGGEKSKDTFDYLTALGDADNGLETKPISEEERKRYLGLYRYGPNQSDHLEIKLNSRAALTLVISGSGQQTLHHLGEHVFYPAGAFATRMKFDLAAAPATLTITSGPHSLTAKRNAPK